MSVILKQYDILLDIKRATTNNKIEVVEGDNGNIFHITLTDNNEPVDLSDTRVVAVFSNSDGTAEQDTGDTAYGEYVFTYDSVADHWNESVLRGSNDITYFGITLTGTPSNNDTITVTYDEDGATATTTVSGGSVSVNVSQFVRSMASVLILGDDNNEVYILVHAGSFSSSGINECELQVYSGSDQSILVTTAKFNFQSRRSSMNDETIQSEEKYPILVGLIADATNALNYARPFEHPSVSATTLDAGDDATVELVMTDSSVAWNFGIPRGEGSPSSDTPKALGTAAAGSKIEYSRADHIHPMPSASSIPTSTEGVDVQTALNGKEDTISDLETIRSNATNGQTAYTRSTDKVLYLSSVAISATTGDIATVSDAKITADHVLIEIEFANPSAIASDVTWTTSTGSLVLNGTCSTATTANIVLIKKDN